MGACESVNNFPENRIKNGQYKPVQTYDESQSSSYTVSRNGNSREGTWFPKGEKYYSIIKDSNQSNLLSTQKTWQSENVELFFSLTNTINSNYFYSLSVTVINNERYGVESYLGELDSNKGTNIVFGNSFVIDYFYERRQIIIISPILNNNKMDKKYKFVLGDVMRNKTLDINIPNFGTVKMDCVTLNYSNNMNQYNIDLLNTFSVFQFDIGIFNIDMQSSPNLFFVISHLKDKHKKRPVYKSPEYSINNLQTNYIQIESYHLCANTKDRIYIDIYSYQQQPVYIGGGHVNLNILQSNSLHKQNTEITLHNPYRETIGLARINFHLKQRFSFINKLKENKMQINLEIAIDYTKSNKPPDDPTSNHFINGAGLNDYEKAIKSCCEVLAQYDADQLFPVYGFGGIPYVLNGVANNKVSHCFNINFQRDAEIHGVQNILNAYRDSLYKVQLAGNTKFSFILKKVIENVNNDLKYHKKENHYYILLILTDGKVNDLKETIDLIVEASYLPMSIVIVGIGEEDFEFMEELDGDENPLINSKREVRKRDIVQFIKFNNFKANNGLKFGTDFAEEVLKEIPRQIEEYYDNVGKFY